MRNISSNFLALALALAAPAVAQVSGYGQCGGENYQGSTTCVSGWTCTYSNPYYSQCLPGSSSSSSTVKSTTTSKTTSTTTSSKTTTTPTTTTKTTTTTSSTSTSAPAPSGFVTTSGQKFTLNGATYTLVGSNAYWVGLQGYTAAQINQAFSDIAKSGATTVRTWGFNEVTTTYSGEDYYQSWSGSTPTINTGATGLANFDTVVAAAKANGLRLIVTLTNNWSDYGGMDVYTTQLTGSADHDVFYTNALTQAAYKNYVATWVARYKNEPTIFAWELANEPRCSGSTPITSGTCTAATVTAWIKTMSAYIKSLDSNHLVAIGDEGWFNEPSSPLYPYNAGESIGIDFVANLAISTVDFGTFHLYPESWGQSANTTEFGVGWIQDHAAAQKVQNKPVILEEFGVITANQSTTYTTWLNTVISSGLTGDLIWQAGSHFSTGDTPNDGYAVYPDGPVYPIVKAHAAALKARG